MACTLRLLQNLPHFYQTFSITRSSYGEDEVRGLILFILSCFLRGKFLRSSLSQLSLFNPKVISFSSSFVTPISQMTFDYNRKPLMSSFQLSQSLFFFYSQSFFFFDINHGIHLILGLILPYGPSELEEHWLLEYRLLY